MNFHSTDFQGNTFEKFCSFPDGEFLV